MKQKFVDLEFTDGKKIRAHMDGFTIDTDQPISLGGTATAPCPFQCFLASLATCAGAFASYYCETHNIALEGLGIRMNYEWDSKGIMVKKVAFALTLPKHFPEEHIDGLIQMVDQFAVKQHLFNPPSFEITTKREQL